jgi:hypothetical protein
MFEEITVKVRARSVGIELRRKSNMHGSSLHRRLGQFVVPSRMYWDSRNHWQHGPTGTQNPPDIIMISPTGKKQRWTSVVARKHVIRLSQLRPIVSEMRSGG